MSEHPTYKPPWKRQPRQRSKYESVVAAVVGSIVLLCLAALAITATYALIRWML